MEMTVAALIGLGFALYGVLDCLGRLAYRIGFSKKERWMAETVKTVDEVEMAAHSLVTACRFCPGIFRAVVVGRGLSPKESEEAAEICRRLSVEYRGEPVLPTKEGLQAPLNTV